MKKISTHRDIQAEMRRSQFLDAALTLFAERGVENVSLKDLAAAVGVAPGLIYHYFPSKNDLIKAVFLENNPLPEFEAILNDISSLPAHEGLLLFTRRLTQLLPEKRQILRLLTRELLSPRSIMLREVMTLRQEVLARFSGYFESRMAAGELRPHPPLVPLHMLISSLLILLLLDQPLDISIEPFVELIWEGIRGQGENQ